MRAAEMISKHPHVEGHLNDPLAKAIEELLSCPQVCTSCADACLGEENVADMRKGLVRLDIDDDGMVRGEERFPPELGRVNDVEARADGSIVVLTDKKDGEVIRITPVDGE